MENNNQEQTQRFETMFRFLREEGRNGGIDIPEEIIKMLAKWALLYDVPFAYLVLRAEMLPKESIRFFHLDPAYVVALLDGALSLGRCFDIDYTHDAEIIAQAIAQARRESYLIRGALQGKPAASLSMPQNAGNAPITGFLLHSTLVRGWRGLEFKALGREKSTPLRALRLETLGPEILLGLYEGEISTLEVAQPPEGMHYGFAHKKGSGYEKQLRRLTDGSLYEGAEGKLADVSLHSEAFRVVDMQRTLNNIASLLPDARADSTLAALELIQNPFTGIVENKND